MALARNPGLERELAAALRETESKISLCDRCGNLTPREINPCRLCTDDRRDDRVLCVVEDPGDLARIERSGAFKGRYFALLGKLSPQRNEGVHNTRIEALLARIAEGTVEEVIVALNTDVESDATAHFIREAIAAGGRPVRVTRPALGIPSGGGVAYADARTLAGALQSRQDL